METAVTEEGNATPPSDMNESKEEEEEEEEERDQKEDEEDDNNIGLQLDCPQMTVESSGVATTVPVILPLPGDSCMANVEELEPTIQNIPVVVGSGIPGDPQDVIDETFTDAENYVLESGEIAASAAELLAVAAADDGKLSEAMQNELLDVASGE